jgi:hypothetical protein
MWMCAGNTMYTSHRHCRHFDIYAVFSLHLHHASNCRLSLYFASPFFARSVAGLSARVPVNSLHAVYKPRLTGAGIH